MAKRPKRNQTAAHVVLTEMRVRSGRRSRKLTKAETEYLIQMFAVKSDIVDFDVLSLAPVGSFLSMMARHFEKTDISYALPIMQLLMIAASKLTQAGVSLEVPGIGKIKPTQWTVGLADSGSSKTLACEELLKILGEAGAPPVRMLPEAATDAQWIIELSEFNGSFWFQDEVGKKFNAILTSQQWTRAKPWMLNAYSHQSISNRLKSEKQKLEIDSPHFTFHGLSVFSTWKSDIDAASMLDGFCQRFNFYIADRRQDTDMYDHFLYFADDGIEDDRAHLKSTWDALCHQPGAFETYTLNDEVLPFLKSWWLGLRNTIGKCGLPASFVRRIGFSIMRYMTVLQFILGKSRMPIDLETALLATKYAEYHMRSALAVLQDYNQSAASGVQKVATLREDILSKGGTATTRNVTRKLSKAQRENLPRELIDQILQVLNALESPTELFETVAQPKEKSEALCQRRDKIAERLKLNERKRNERRLRNLRLHHAQHMPSLNRPNNHTVVPFRDHSGSDDFDPFDLTG